jgi:hypothetical protein
MKINTKMRIEFLRSLSKEAYNAWTKGIIENNEKDLNSAKAAYFFLNKQLGIELQKLEEETA